MLSEKARQEIRELPSHFPQLRSAVMPALDVAQEELGWLPPEAIAEVAELLGLDTGYLEGVATFYTLFHLQPTGRRHLSLCTNLSCSLRGAGELLEHIKEKIGVSECGEVSSDGEFSVEEVECLGACEFAPVMRSQHRFHYDLDERKVDALIASPTPSPSAKPRN
ncbi:MAG: NADH-quinone oxidoreductase subunit NuoE [Candidatus Dormibacteraceae bacterium]